jgi:hypothetical protein
MVIERVGHYRYHIALIAALSLGVLHESRAGDMTFSTGLDYSTGKYGSTSSTDIYFLPLTLKYEWGRSTLKTTLPYLRVTSGATTRTTQDGMGDWMFSYGYSLFEQPRNGFLVDLIGKFKLATADESKGLGTGKNDYAAQIDLYYLAGALSPFMTVGYRMPGDPPGQNLRDVWYGTLGLGYKVSPSDSIGAMWDMRQASRTSGSGPVTVDVDGHVISGLNSSELTVYWVHKFRPDIKMQVYAVKGFSDASADKGLGLMVSKMY